MSGISRLGARFGAVVAAQLAFIAAGMAAAPAVLAASSTLHVGGSNCSSSGPGTSTSPYCTISQAAAVAAAGQTVLVAPGTYPERVSPPRSGTAGSPIVYQAASGGTVTVNSSTTGISISGRSYVTIDGFNIFDTVGIGISVSSSSNIVISNNTVSYAGTPASGQVATGISLNNTSNSTVTGNYTHHNSDSGIYLSNGSTGNVVSYNESSFNARQYQRNANGINVVAPGNTITGNVLHDNEDSGLQFYPGGDNNVATVNVSYGNGDHGIDDLNVTGGRLIGNTIYHNCTSGINVEGTSGSYVVKNNVSVDNAVFKVNPTPIKPGAPPNDCNRRAGNIGIWDSAPPSTTVDSNLVYLSVSGTMYVFGSSYSSLAAMQAATGQETHGKQANPGFADAANGNLRLTEGSPAIDSADSAAPFESATDVTGAARADDPQVANTGLGSRKYDDRGAYEFQSGPPPPPQPPTAQLAVSPSSGTAPLTVTADASGSTDPQGQALTYSFAFGDGTSAGPQSAPTAAHTYSAAGSYTVTVTVTDTSNLSSTASAGVSVSAPVQAPTASLTVSPASGTAPLAVTADASGSTDPQGQALTYSFAFGDGTSAGPQSAPTAAHTYSAAGSYTVTVTVTDTSNLSSTASAGVAVSAPGGGGGTATYVSQIATNYSTSVHTSGSITVWRTQGVAAGDLMVLTLQLTGTAPTGAVSGTDDAGNTFAVARDVADGAGDRLVVLYGVAHTALVPNQKISVTFPSATSYRLAGDEVAGVSTVDQQAAASGSGSSYASGPTGTTASGGEFVFGAVGLFAGSSPSWASGWTAESSYSVGTNWLGRAYRIPSGTGSFNATGTGSGTWLAICVTFH